MLVLRLSSSRTNLSKRLPPTGTVGMVWLPRKVRHILEHLWVKSTHISATGKYTWLERSFEDEEKDAETSADKGKAKAKDEPDKVPDSKLAPEIQVSSFLSKILHVLIYMQALCRLIFSTKYAYSDHIFGDTR